jgi:hypothetical protein
VGWDTSIDAETFSPALMSLGVNENRSPIAWARRDEWDMFLISCEDDDECFMTQREE